jgi:phosphoglycerate kinase
MTNLKSLTGIDVSGKTVLLRADLDVPLSKGEISDDYRLIISLETIDYLLKKARKVIIIGHLGRPEKEDKSLSLQVVARWFTDKLKGELKETEVNGFPGWEILPGLVLLENLRFYKEEENPSTTSGQAFSQKLASLADIYVNDAFASSHRAHASIVGVTKYLPSFAGLRLEKEIEELSKILNDPKRPLVVIIGGAKIETKLPLVERMHHFADYVLVGGEIAENDKILLKVAHENLQGKKSVLLIADLTQNIKDVTVKSAENFVQVCQNGASIVWNGPMGQVEEKEYQTGTEILASGLAKLSSNTIVGGGDTLAFLKEKNLIDKFSFASTGGGAMLEFLAGIKLPGLEALKK